MVMFHPVAFDVSFRVQFRVQIVRLTHRLASMPRLKNPALGPLCWCIYSHYAHLYLLFARMLQHLLKRGVAEYTTPRVMLVLVLPKRGRVHGGESKLLRWGRSGDV